MAEHKLPELGYAYEALEPAISGEIMKIHHSAHHQTYVNNLNASEKAYAQAASSADVKKQIELQSAIKFNGGGHINHSLFWKNLAPQKDGGGKLADGALKQAIDKEFGSLDKLKETFNKQTAAIQGSGWGWLVWNTSQTGKLEIITLKDQDPVTAPYVPLIGVDVWEHAYYLQYKNKRPDYLNAIWSVINFAEAEKRLKAALGGQASL